MNTSLYKGLKKHATKSIPIDDYLVVEAPLEIQINDKPFTVVMRTPGNDLELVRGLLYAEDVYKEPTPLQIKELKAEENGFRKLNVIIPREQLRRGYLNKRSLLSVSSCGICGKQELEDFGKNEIPLENKLKLDLKKLPEMFQNMNSRQHIFHLTGGSHAAAIFDKNYNCISLKEDIGRHNTVDKCVGELLNNNTLKTATFLLVSGRVSYEIISKAFFAKITYIIAVSACSSLAVDYAKEFGICLIGFSRNEKSTVYAHPSKIGTS